MSEPIWFIAIDDWVKSRSRRLVIKCIAWETMPMWARIRYSETRQKSGFYLDEAEYRVYSQ